MARRAGGRARLEAGSRRADALAAGRARGARRVRPERRRGRERRGDGGGARRRSRPAPSRSPRATCSSNGVAVRKGTWLGLADGEPVAGGDELRRGRARGRSSGCSPSRAGVLTLLTGRGAAGARRRSLARARRRASRARARGARGRPAALRAAPGGGVAAGDASRSASSSSRTTTCSARPSSCCSACAATSRSWAASRRRRGRRAVRARLQPDVVLMDYRMPGLDGAQATRAVLTAAPARASSA